ncbi:imm11 family protein [Myxococcus faecalis]|uniref:imm11 family protein n=1 Tax=Myxococcus faecalis TaxID=3115646 RepID=UPI003CEDCE98
MAEPVRTGLAELTPTGFAELQRTCYAELRQSSVSRMRIDPAKVEGAKVFRTWSWTVALIVSEEIKEALERAGITGAKFTDVTGPGAANDL